MPMEVGRKHGREGEGGGSQRNHNHGNQPLLLLQLTSHQPPLPSTFKSSCSPLDTAIRDPLPLGQDVPGVIQ